MYPITYLERLTIVAWYFDEERLVKNGPTTNFKNVLAIVPFQWDLLQDRQPNSSYGLGECIQLSQFMHQFEVDRQELRSILLGKYGDNLRKQWSGDINPRKRENFVLCAFIEVSKDPEFAKFHRFVIDLKADQFLEDDGQGFFDIIKKLVDYKGHYDCARIVTPTIIKVFNQWTLDTPDVDGDELNLLKWNCVVSRSIFITRACRIILEFFCSGDRVEKSSSQDPTRLNRELQISETTKENLPKNRRSRRNKKRNSSFKASHDIQWERCETGTQDILESKSASLLAQEPTEYASSSSYTMPRNQSAQEISMHGAGFNNEKNCCTKAYNLNNPENSLSVKVVPELVYKRVTGVVLEGSEKAGEEEEEEEKEEEVTNRLDKSTHLHTRIVTGTNEGFQQGKGGLTEIYTQRHDENVSEEGLEENIRAKISKGYEGKLRLLENEIGERDKKLRAEIKEKLLIQEEVSILRRKYKDAGNKLIMAKGFCDRELEDMRISTRKEIENTKEATEKAIEKAMNAAQLKMETLKAAADKRVKMAKKLARTEKKYAESADNKVAKKDKELSLLTEQLKVFHEQLRTLETTLQLLTDKYAQLKLSSEANIKVMKGGYKMVVGLRDSLKVLTMSGRYRNLSLLNMVMLNASVKELKQLLQTCDEMKWEQALIRESKSDTLEPVAELTIPMCQ